MAEIIYTPSMRTITVERLIEKAGGVHALAKQMRVHRVTVLGWRRTGLIPARRVTRIAKAYSIPVTVLMTIATGGE